MKELKCKDCLYFKGDGFTYNGSCSSQGKFADNEACSKFTINLFKLDLFDKKCRCLGKLQVKTNSQLKHLSQNKEIDGLSIKSIAYQELKNRRKGYTLGEIYYYKIFRGDYLNNYAKVAVVAVNNEGIYVQGYYGNDLKVFRSQLPLNTESLLTEEQFDEVRKDLIKKHLIIDPEEKTRFKFIKSEKISTYKVKEDLDEGINYKQEYEKELKRKKLEKAADRMLKENPFQTLDSSFVEDNDLIDFD